MKKETKKLVEDTLSLQEDLNKLSVDAVNEVKGDEPEMQEASFENICKREGVPYIKPKRRLSPPIGILPKKLKQEHARSWEYVKGIYENLDNPGESIVFALCVYPGDADYLWEVPANTPVAVPRMVAHHLEAVQQYHTFDHKKVGDNLIYTDHFTHEFTVTGVKFRGKFRAIGAFA